MPRRTTRRRRFRLWLLMSLGMIFVAAIATWRALDTLAIDWLRPRIERELELLTGLPVSAGGLVLAVRPTPRVSVLDVSFGDGDFRGAIARLDLYPRVRELLWRRAEISSIDLVELSLILPATSERRRVHWSDVVEHIGARLRDEGPEQDAFVQSWVVHRVTAQDVALRLGAEEEIRVRFAADGVLSDVVEIVVEAAIPGTGGSATLDGTIDTRAAGDSRPPQLDLKLVGSKITGPLLDEILFKKPRGLRGLFSGRLELAAPVRGSIRATLSEANGRLRWSAEDGSFGRLGLATQITAILRSTEVLRLRLPSLRDEGLVFDTVGAGFAMKEGRLEIEAFELEATSYAITATGFLDYREERSDVPIQIHAIRGLAPGIDRIPVVGDAFRIVDVRLVATGPPSGMKIGVESIEDQILGASAAGPNAVVKGIRDLLALLRGES